MKKNEMQTLINNKIIESFKLIISDLKEKSNNEDKIKYINMYLKNLSILEAIGKTTFKGEVSRKINKIIKEEKNNVHIFAQNSYISEMFKALSNKSNNSNVLAETESIRKKYTQFINSEKEPESSQKIDKESIIKVLNLFSEYFNMTENKSKDNVDSIKNEADIILNDLIEKKEEKTVNKNKKVKKNK